MPPNDHAERFESTKAIHSEERLEVSYVGTSEKALRVGVMFAWEILVIAN